MLSSKNNKELKQISKNLRIKVLELAKKTGGKGSHLGGTFSSIEIIVALYYAGILKFKKKIQNGQIEIDYLLVKGIFT